MQPPYIYKGFVLKIIDGDTLDILVDLGFHIQKTIRVRIYGINCPETRGEEKDAGLKSKNFVKELIDGKEILLKTHKDKKDKYGRWLAEIQGDFGPDLPSDLSSLLISKGLAQPYKE
jgi:micrococcal nuclease